MFSVCGRSSSVATLYSRKPLSSPLSAGRSPRPGYGIEAHAHLDLAHVRVDRHEARARVAVGLARLPGRGRRLRLVVVGEEHHFLVVEEVDERPVVLVELLGSGLDRPGVGDLERAAERRLRAVDLDRGTIGFTSAGLCRWQAGSTTALTSPTRAMARNDPQVRRTVMRESPCAVTFRQTLPSGGTELQE